MTVKIGITTVFDKDGKEYVPQPYLDALEAAGATVIAIPSTSNSEQIKALLEDLDGIVYPGGPGITVGLVGDLPDDLRPVEAARDARDRLVYNTFNSSPSHPILGICYGMQFINAMQGGTIYADLSEQLEGANNHSSSRGADPHLIHVKADTHLHRILGSNQIEVNTYHIQSIAELGVGLRVSAIAPDGVIEAVESEDGRLLGVQFHPERMGEAMQALFADFVERCRRD